MENLNKLSFKYKEIDLSVISKSKENIKFKYDTKESVDLYYFKVLQIVPVPNKKLEVELYLKTDMDLNDGIYRMSLPEFPIVSIDRIVPGYEGEFEELPPDQQFVVKYTWFDKYTKVNLGLQDLYIVVIGYPTQLRWENDYTLRNKDIPFVQDFKKTELNIGINREIEKAFINIKNSIDSINKEIIPLSMMHGYEQLSLFDNEDLKGWEILTKIIGYIGILKEENLREQIDSKLDSIFELYKKYDLNVEDRKQISDAGRIWFNDMEKQLQLNNKKLFHPTTLEELNELITRLLGVLNGMLDKFGGEDVSVWLIQTYFCALSEFREQMEA